MDQMPPKDYKASLKHAQGIRKGRTKPSNLREQVNPQSMQAYQHAKEYPTPSANEHKYRLQGNTQASKCLEALARGGHLDQTKNNTNGKNQELLKLNPDWVEQLMGLPVGWTDCDF
jgi:hypothetical protein